MSKHTPGPWHLSFETEYGDFGSVISRGLVGIVSETETICEFNDLYSPQTGANARLIAAAPALLEAAKRCMTILQEQADAGRYPESLIGVGWQWLEAAIKQATEGEQG